jgi:hypothetical protein
MSSGDGERQPAPHTTEIIVATGERYLVEGDLKDVERTILDAARGSIMQLAWLIDSHTREDLVVNPEHVVTLRAAATDIRGS